MNKQALNVIKISSEFITLGQFLKYVDLISSGAEAKIYINEHEILVNNALTKERGKKLYPSYKVSIDNSLFFEIQNDN